MENYNKAKNVLMKIRNHEKEMKKLRDNILAMEIAAGPSAIRYDKDKIIGSPSNFTEDVYVRICDTLSEIDNKEQAMDDVKRSVFSLIQHIDIEQANLLIFYYFDCLNYVECASRIGCSESTIHRIEDDALENLGQYL